MTPVWHRYSSPLSPVFLIFHFARLLLESGRRFLPSVPSLMGIEFTGSPNKDGKPGASVPSQDKQLIRHPPSEKRRLNTSHLKGERL